MTSRRNGLAEAAGAVVYRTTKKGIEVLLVHRPRYDDWSLPKGHLDTGESFEDAAAREVEEETGYRGRLGREIGAVGYRTKSKQKVVRYWLLEAETGKFVPNKEADAARWLAPRKASRIVSYTRDRNVIIRGSQLISNGKRSVVYLIRHANAGQRELSNGLDHERALSTKGRRQAATITTRLLRQPITGVYASEYARCAQTVRPLAEKLGMDVTYEPSLLEGAGTKKLLDFLGGLRSQSAVLGTHRDVISRVLRRLADEGVDFEHQLVWKKASVWELDLRKGKVTGGRYHPPPSSDDR